MMLTSSNVADVIDISREAGVDHVGLLTKEQ